MKSILCRSLLALAAVALLALPLSSAEPVSRGFLNRTFTDAEGKARPFVIFVPVKFEPGSKPPVMLFLHGAGERGNNNLDQIMVGLGPAIWKRKGTFPFVTVIPQCRTGSNWLADGPDAGEPTSP